MMVTIFTPTYNRAYILHNLYNSLQNQTIKAFEWLIIDDGSIDNTEEIIKKWKSEKNKFNIRYYKTENGGKCRAINYALSHAKGKLFFTVDSDDYLTDDAIEKIIKWEEEIPKDNKYCGIAGNLGISLESTPNKLIKGSFFDGNAFDRYKDIDGERAIVFYTDVHKKYNYPIFETENFMTEAVVWNRMAHDGYKIRYYNDIICVYKYQDDGLTTKGHKLFVNNPRGYGLWQKEKCYFSTKSILKHFKMYFAYYCDLYPYYESKLIKEFINMPFIYYIFCFWLKKIKL